MISWDRKGVSTNQAAGAQNVAGGLSADWPTQGCLIVGPCGGESGNVLRMSV